MYSRIVRIVKSQPFYVNLVPPLAQYLFNEINRGYAIRIRRILQQETLRENLPEDMWISLLYFDNFKHNRASIRRVIFIKDCLEFAHAYRITHFISLVCCNLYAIVNRS